MGTGHLLKSRLHGGDLHDRQVGRLSLLQRDLAQFWDGEGLQWLAWLECDVANLLPWLNPEWNGGRRLRKKIVYERLCV